MTATLLLRLEGPMQSWGTQSRFRDRDTDREPSKSGVLGLICAALGRHRREPIADLVTLRLGVRVDRQGDIDVDYHTALKRANDKQAVISERAYLADASFLVGLESNDEVLLRMVDAALARPHWPLYLGRKAFPPSVPVHIPADSPYAPSIRRDSLEAALVSVPPLQLEREPSWRARPLRFVIEDPAGSSLDLRNDVPLSFADRSRFGTRAVTTCWRTISA